MELTVLGSCGTWPGPGRAASGYLVRHDGASLWMDVGTGTLAAIQRHGGLDDLGGICISHVHADHMLDLIPTYYAIRYGGIGRRGIPLMCTEDVIGRAASIVGSEQELRDTFDVRPLRPGDDFEVGAIHVGTVAMAHFDLPALGFRVTADGATLAYTGDTGPSPSVVQLGRSADVLLAEAVWQDGDEGGPFHLSAREAGEHARAAGARVLALTHIWPNRDRERSVREAAEAFGGTVVAPVEDETLEVGA